MVRREAPDLAHVFGRGGDPSALSQHGFHEHAGDPVAVVAKHPAELLDVVVAREQDLAGRAARQAFGLDLIIGLAVSGNALESERLAPVPTALDLEDPVAPGESTA